MKNKNKPPEEIRVFKTPLIVPLSVVMVIVLYVGYSIYSVIGEDTGLIHLLKEISFEIFLLCEFGLISLILYNKNQLKKFLAEHAVIDNILTLEKLQPIIRTNMYSALFGFAFLGLGSLTAIMSIIHQHKIIGIIVVLLTVTTAKLIAWYAPLEECVKQIKTSDKLLDSDLDNMLRCWVQNIFPNF